jgi:cardiolipin synthase
MSSPPVSATATRALDRAAGSPPIPGNAVALLIDGPEAFPAMLEVIAKAERWLHFENYIIRSDATGWRFAEALAAKAKTGVRVRVLADWLGSAATKGKYWRFLRAAGVDVRIFQPFAFGDPLLNLSRDHRKLVCADGADAIVGGPCIGDEWSGDTARGALPWRDTAVRIQGPAAAALDAAFARSWAASGSEIQDDERAGRIPVRGDAAVRVVAGEPGQARTYRLLTAVAAGATSRLWITDAYLAPPPPLRIGLIDAARDGCDVQLLVPGMSDVPFVANLSRVGYRDLLGQGIRIHEWAGPMLHAKTFVADGRFSRIGSSNLNYASLLGNWELDVLIEDAAFATQLEQRFRKDLTGSREVVLRAPATGRRSKLSRPDSPTEVHTHRTTRREKTRRAIVTLYSVAMGAGRSLFLPIFGSLALLGVVAYFLPRVVAGGVTLIALWLAQSAFRQIRRQRPAPTPGPDDRVRRT